MSIFIMPGFKDASIKHLATAALSRMVLFLIVSSLIISISKL
ncbi:hypothetical protein OAT42_03235 [Alphaproteobacteria bacterium]|nr:hypothetical protein [Alphaproteobacteria bacterium]